MYHCHITEGNNRMQPGEYKYEMQGDKPLAVTASVRINRLDVYIDPISRSPLPQIRLFISFTDTNIVVWDLYGNNKGGPLHRQGLGALAVNTAIQFLRVLCPEHATLGGHVYDAQRGRVTFWRRFKFQVTEPNAMGDQHLRGTLGALSYATDGNAMGEHPRIFDISLMTRMA
jgi:hypothetical protein